MYLFVEANYDMFNSLVADSPPPLQNVCLKVTSKKDYTLNSTKSLLKKKKGLPLLIYPK